MFVDAEMRRELDRIHEIIKNCHYKEQTGLKVANLIPHGVLVQCVVHAINDKTEEPDLLQGPKCFIQLGETEDKIVMEIFKLWQWWEEHECAESFRYQGVKIYDPHTTGRNF